MINEAETNGHWYPEAIIFVHLWDLFLGNDRQVAFALRSCFLGTLRLLGAEETPSMGAMPDTSLKQICGFSDFKKTLSEQR